MKKIATIISSLFIITGLKAQVVPVKKETVKPATVKPAPAADSLKSGKAAVELKQTLKPIKAELPTKETALPGKGTSPVAKPGKY